MPLEIIGPGFGRTGTNSVKLALERLGFGPCHHMREVAGQPERLPLWERAATGEEVDWEAVFAGFRSQLDWPGARFWRELNESYPSARGDPHGTSRQRLVPQLPGHHRLRARPRAR